MYLELSDILEKFFLSHIWVKNKDVWLSVMICIKQCNAVLVILVIISQHDCGSLWLFIATKQEK